jgi:hypothetical protein
MHTHTHRIHAPPHVLQMWIWRRRNQGATETGALHRHAVLGIAADTAPPWFVQHSLPFARAVFLMRDTRVSYKAQQKTGDLVPSSTPQPQLSLSLSLSYKEGDGGCAPSCSSEGRPEL